MSEQMLQQLMQGAGGGGAPPGMPPGGPEAGGPPPPPPPPEGGEGGQSGEDLIREMLDILNEYRTTEEDDEDLAIAEQVGSLLQKLLANNQKELSDAMGGKLSPRLMKQAYGG